MPRRFRSPAPHASETQRLVLIALHASETQKADLAHQLFSSWNFSDFFCFISSLKNVSKFEDCVILPQLTAMPLSPRTKSFPGVQTFQTIVTIAIIVTGGRFLSPAVSHAYHTHIHITQHTTPVLCVCLRCVCVCMCVRARVRVSHFVSHVVYGFSLSRCNKDSRVVGRIDVVAPTGLERIPLLIDI